MLKLLVEKLNLINRVEGEKVFCACGHLFTPIEGKWVCWFGIKGEIVCGECHQLRRKEITGYADQC